MALQVRCLNRKYQSGLLPESQGAGAIQAGNALHAARLCLRFPCAWLYLAGMSLCAGRSSRGREARPFSVRKWRFGVENGSERRLRRGRSRPRGLVVTVSGTGLFFRSRLVLGLLFRSMTRRQWLFPPALIPRSSRPGSGCRRSPTRLFAVCKCTALCCSMLSLLRDTPIS